MADGQATFSAPILRHEPGIYLNLPMAHYLRDDALSGSGLKKLLTSAPDWKWELPDNPLYRAPESDARALGSVVHVPVLEGMAAYEALYFVAPVLDDSQPNIMRTADDMKRWCKDHDIKVSGTKAELWDRIKGHWQVLSIGGAPGEDEPMFWEEYIEREAQGREVLKAEVDRFVRQAAGTVHAWPEARALLSGGLPEVSMFWQEDDVRYKARFDYLSPTAVVDLKKFGQAPPRGLSLRTYLTRELIKYNYDIQAVHNWRAATQLPSLIKAGLATASGSDATARLELLSKIADAYDHEAPEFSWLFLRVPGPPQGWIMPFPRTKRRWKHAVDDCEEAVQRFRDFRDTCGDGQWIEVGVGEFDDDDVPAYAWEIAR